MLHKHAYYLTHQSVLNTNLENDHARIMTSSKQIERRVGSQHPEAFMFTSERMQASTFGHVPHTDALVLRVGENEFLTWVKQHT